MRDSVRFSSLPGSTPQSIFFGGLFLLRVMDTRVKPAYDAAREVEESDIVFRSLQNRRRHAAADEFADRSRPHRSALALHPICAARPQAADREHCFAGDLRILAAWKPAALSAGGALCAVGRYARRARRHRGAWRIDRP